MQIPDTLAALAVPIDQLRPYAGNPRRGNLDVLMESLATTGQYRPVVGNRRTGEVLAGNHTLAAAVALGWSELAVTWVDVDDDTARRVVLVDNRSNDLAGYDDAELAALLESVTDLTGTGFTDADVAALLASTSEPAALTDPDDAPALPTADPISVEGDVWVLGGEHRVMCGDATSPDAVATLLAGQTADLLWTDPPYGVAYVGKTADALRIANDDLSAAQLGELLKGSLANARDVLRPGGAFYVCSPSGPLETTFRSALAAVDLGLRQQIVWVKDRFVLGRQDYHGRHETILFGWRYGAEPDAPPLYDDAHQTVLYGWRAGAGHEWAGGRKQDTVWEVPRPKASRVHPTMKPVDLCRRALLNSSPVGGGALDLFAGSGTLAIAAYGTRRRSWSMELDPRYVDVICRRWQEHTGQLPVLERTDAPHDFDTADAA